METGDFKLKSKIVAQNVYKSFPGSDNTNIEILHDVNLSINENEFVVILGPGQCGKTTFLNMVAGLQQPSGGQILLDGQPILQCSPKVAMVFQRMALFPWETVMGNVAMGPKLNGIGKNEREKIAKHYIKMVGLAGFEKSLPHQLSGGMKQRVGIARAYANNPDVLIMDEPFGHLDAQTRYQMEDEIIRIWGQDKRTVIFVTNNIEEALYLGDRIILLSRCPAKVKAEYVIDLPRPRHYTDSAFLELRRIIADNSDLAL